MTRRETVIKALTHKETKTTPFFAEFTYQEYLKMVDFTGDERFLDKYGVYLHYMQYCGYPTEMYNKKGYFKDDFGVIWNRSGVDKDIGVVDDPIIKEPDISLYHEPNFDEKKLREECEKLISTKEDKFCFAGIGFTMFERLWSYLGMEDSLIYMITDKDFIHSLLDKICDFDLKIIRIFNEYPFDGIYLGDDWGQQKGMIMGAPLWREFIKPRMKRLYDEAKKGGKFILQHSCGDVSDIMEDLIEIGLDCYQTFQPEIYDMVEVKSKYGDRLAFWGGISTQRDLPYKTPEQIKNIVKQSITKMKKNGGYIVAPTHAIPSDVPPENVIAMLEEFNNQ